MKTITIEMPDELYEKALKMAETMNITFDKLCELAIIELAKKYEAGELQTANKKS